MTSYKRKITLDKFNSYCDSRTKTSLGFQSETSKPANNLLWIAPNVLAGNTAFQVRKRCELPKLFKEILEKTVPGHSSIICDNHKKYYALITTTTIYLYLYQSEPVNIEMKLKDHHETLPFVNIFHTNDKISLAVTNAKTNKVLYWDNVLVSKATTYTLPLRSQADVITATCTLNQQKLLVVGTRMGDLFPLALKKDLIQPISHHEDDDNTGVVSYISSFFIKRPLFDSPAAEQEERIVGIVNVLDTVYVLTEKHIQVWHVDSNLQLKLTANISILKDLVESISQHIPNNVSIDNIRIEPLDIDSKLKNELVLLSSYQLPVMGDYIQYAASTISIKNTPDESTHFRIKHTASAPFSANTQSSSIPKLSISKSIAFITFDSHVIAVSRNKKSAFEEPVVLSDDDRILCTQVEREGQEGCIESATIYTLKSGIFDYDIDIQKIQGAEIDGNMYAGYVSNTVDLDTSIIQSKLEQAVLFGASQDTSIRFPLSIEQEDISSAVSKVLDELMENTLFLPLSLDAELRAEARYVFVNRIFEVLLENNLRSYVNIALRVKLMNCAEICYIAVYLLQEYNGFVDDEPLTKVWSEAAKNTSVLMKNKGDVKVFFSTEVNKIYQFLDQAISVCFTDIVQENDRPNVVYKMLDILMRVLESGRYFKESFTPLYEIEENKDKDHLLSKLVACFEKTAKYVLDNDKQGNSKLVEKLYEVADKLMECQKTDSQREDDVPTLVMKYVLLLGKSEFAIKLAEKNQDFTTIVRLTNDKSNKGDVITRNAAWIDKLGTPYLLYLFKWLGEQGKDEEILEFDSKYPNQVATFFSKVKLSVSWKYYLQHKQYEECLNAIFIVLVDEKQVKKRQELLAWAKMITLQNERDKNREANVFENTNYTDVSVLLEHEYIQVQLLNEFNKYLLRTDSTNKLTTIMNKYCLKSRLGNNTDLEDFSNAIKTLLQGISLSEHQLVFLLLHISGYKTVVENITTALQLVSHMKNLKCAISKSLQNTIWKEIYYRDVNAYQATSSGTHSDVSVRSIMQGTLVFRILNSARKSKIEVDQMIEPSKIEFEDNDDDKRMEIGSKGFGQFINQICLLASDNSSLTLQEMKTIIQI
ncbi:hypothetical protein K501DRAFT_330522 [Backusella circina FSU 941]|nr:hypothetical protein K501DRAFT_330522 [Backusella circina FSU 941]